MNKEDVLRKLPSVDILLNHPTIHELEQKYPRELIKNSIQNSLAMIRKEILTAKRESLPVATELEALIRRRLQNDVKFSLERVVNATGTVLHTNLGRAVLSSEVREHFADIAFHYSNLEFDLATGKRGSRYDHLLSIIRQLTGAEDALVVNNNAAAVLLVLDTLVKGKEILVSRGELVEIGGMFRIPEVISCSGGTIHEVGTTNKTHLADYVDAVNNDTGAILKVHTSNYRIVGFSESVSVSELAELAHRQGLPLIHDLGSGLLLDLQQFGLPYEPTVRDVLKQGCDIVTFSGDKLLGATQAGIIAGSRRYISAMRKNQLLRALRVDKMTLAALEATLRLYLDEKTAIEKIPILKMIALTAEECRDKAETLATALRQLQLTADISVMVDQNQIGGGAYPENLLPGYVVAIQSREKSVNELEEGLRKSEIPVIARIKNNQLYLDVRTIDEEEYPIVVKALRQVLTTGIGKDKK